MNKKIFRWLAIIGLGLIAGALMRFDMIAQHISDQNDNPPIYQGPDLTPLPKPGVDA